MATLTQLRERFDKIVTYINRDGVDDLIKWLEDETDFFTAPASVNHHGNYDGGLLEHSLHVTELAINNFNYILKYKPELSHLKESVILSALFHDVCKINQYHWGDEKWTKNSDNRWVSYQAYSFKDPLPMGHGEKSIYYISKFVKLSTSEILAIRWHMSTSEPGTQIDGMTKWSYSQAFEDPLVKIITSADQLSTLLGETIDRKSIAASSN